MLTEHFTQFVGFEKVSVCELQERQVEGEIWPIQSWDQGVEAI